MLEYLERLSDASSVEQLWALHTAKMAEFGFSHMLYGKTNQFNQRGFGDPDDILLLSNHPADYIKRFVGDGLYLDAPMVQWARHNTGEMSWAWMEKNRHSFDAAALRVIEFNRQHGVRAGYSISFPEQSQHRKAAIGLTAAPGMSQADVDALWQRSGREIRVLNMMMHLKLASLPHPLPGLHLTERQRQVLELAGMGLSAQEIALQMKLTRPTIEKHLRLARETLGVDTTTHAVLKATVQNQIYFVPA